MMADLSYVKAEDLNYVNKPIKIKDYGKQKNITGDTGNAITER